MYFCYPHVFCGLCLQFRNPRNLNNKTTWALRHTKIPDRLKSWIALLCRYFRLWLIEILAEGFDWSEGPLWIEKGNYLLFSDIPPNKIMSWDEKKDSTTYLYPSGYTGTLPRGGEPGSNGLILDNQGQACTLPAWRQADGADGCAIG